jgi:hypothetical protein
VGDAMDRRDERADVRRIEPTIRPLQVDPFVQADRRGADLSDDGQHGLL